MNGSCNVAIKDNWHLKIATFHYLCDQSYLKSHPLSLFFCSNGSWNKRLNNNIIINAFALFFAKPTHTFYFFWQCKNYILWTKQLYPNSPVITFSNSPMILYEIMVLPYKIYFQVNLSIQSIKFCEKKIAYVRDIPMFWFISITN